MRVSCSGQVGGGVSSNGSSGITISRGFYSGIWAAAGTCRPFGSSAPAGVPMVFLDRTAAAGLRGGLSSAWTTVGRRRGGRPSPAVTGTSAHRARHELRQRLDGPGTNGGLPSRAVSGGGIVRARSGPCAGSGSDGCRDRCSSLPNRPTAVFAINDCDRTRGGGGAASARPPRAGRRGGRRVRRHRALATRHALPDHRRPAVRAPGGRRRRVVAPAVHRGAGRALSGTCCWMRPLACIVRRDSHLLSS
jgi:hypothetical protein